MNIKKIRKPKNKKALVETSRVTRTKYLSDALPPLEHYDSKVSGYHKDKWFRDAQIYLRAFLAEGMAPEEIKERLGINDSQYDKLEQMLIEHSGARFINMGTAHRYYIYMLRMEQCLRELDDFVQIHIDEDPKKSGVVGAIKAKATILNETMKMGQELGIIAKRAKELRVLGEVNLAVMPTEELVELYEKKMDDFRAVVENTSHLPPAYKKILRKAIDVEAVEKNEDRDEGSEVSEGAA